MISVLKENAVATFVESIALGPNDEINTGTLAMIYDKRWTIEKTFNNSKSNFGERKAWSSNLNALNNQMRFTAIAYNILVAFGI